MTMKNKIAMVSRKFELLSHCKLLMWVFCFIFVLDYDDNDEEDDDCCCCEYDETIQSAADGTKPATNTRDPPALPESPQKLIANSDPQSPDSPKAIDSGSVSVKHS